MKQRPASNSHEANSAADASRGIKPRSRPHPTGEGEEPGLRAAVSYSITSSARARREGEIPRLNCPRCLEV